MFVSTAAHSCLRREKFTSDHKPARSRRLVTAPRHGASDAANQFLRVFCAQPPESHMTHPTELLSVNMHLKHVKGVK